MKIQDILQLKGAEIAMIAPETDIRTAAKKLTERSIGAVVVYDKSVGVAGIISERDIACGFAKFGEVLLSKQVSDLMSNDVITCGHDWGVSQALEVMLDNNIRHLPVVENDFKVVGIVSMRDITAQSAEEIS